MGIGNPFVWVSFLENEHKPKWVYMKNSDKTKYIKIKHLFLMVLIKRLFFLIPLLLALHSCHQRGDVTVLKLAHGLDRNHPVHKGMAYMAERVYEKSDGSMRIDIYPSAQLGSERENAEMLQIGSLAITKVSAAIMEGFAPTYRIFGLPFLFSTREHMHRVLDGEIGREILLGTENIWLRGLTFYDAGSRSFYTKDRPINHPDDLRGLKIRVMQSPSAVNMIRAFGGSPTPISWGELYTALQGGVVDGAENNPPTFYLSRHFETSNYFSLTEHASIPDVLLVSTKIWNNLSEEQQYWLQEAAEESASYQRRLWLESETHSLKRVQEEGIQIIYPDKQPFVEMSEHIYESFRQDQQLFDMIQKIRALY